MLKMVHVAAAEHKRVRLVREAKAAEGAIIEVRVDMSSGLQTGPFSLGRQQDRPVDRGDVEQGGNAILFNGAERERVVGDAQV